MTDTAKTLDPICMWLDYEFRVYDFNVDWGTVPEVGGVYIFAIFEESSWKWFPLYLGETESFAARIPVHEKLGQLRQLRMSHVHVLEVKDEAERKAIEKDLLQSYSTRLNREYRVA